MRARYGAARFASEAAHTASTPRELQNTLRLAAVKIRSKGCRAILAGRCDNRGRGIAPDSPGTTGAPAWAILVAHHATNWKGMHRWQPSRQALNFPPGNRLSPQWSNA